MNEYVFPEEDPHISLSLYIQEVRQVRQTYLAYVNGRIYTAANIHDDVCPDVLVIKKKKLECLLRNTTVYFRKKKQHCMSPRV